MRKAKFVYDLHFACEKLNLQRRESSILCRSCLGRITGKGDQKSVNGISQTINDKIGVVTREACHCTTVNIYSSLLRQRKIENLHNAGPPRRILSLILAYIA